MKITQRQRSLAEESTSEIRSFKAMLSSSTNFYQFGFDDVIVDRENFRVQKGGEDRDLTPRAFDVLVFLVENHGRVVEKQELFEHVWKEKFVSDNALTRAVKEVRHVIGDTADSPRYIETVTKRGYRFVAPVNFLQPSENQSTRTILASNTNGDDTRAARETIIDSLSNRQLKRGVIAQFARRELMWVGAALAAIAIAAIVVIRFGNKAAVVWSKPIEARSVQVTTWTGLDIFPTISPDGNSVAYSSDHNGKFEIYVKALMPGARENQLTADGQQNLEPSWSPDGKLIAYYSKIRGGIWLVPAGGGGARQLVDFGSRPAWSPDGSQIAFQSDGLSDISATSTVGPSSTIWIVPVQGGSPEQITRPGNPEGGHGSPAWSPDARHIAFVVNNILTSNIWSVSPRGSDLKRVTSEGHGFFDPVYAPDGTSLFVSDGGVWRITLSADGEASGSPERVANPALAQVRTLSISANGKRIASSLVRTAGNLWSVPISKASAERSGAPTPFVEDTSQRKTTPLFSNDGSRIAYTARLAGESGTVWTAGADGKERTLLSPDQSTIVGWMPEGHELSSVSYLHEGQFLTVTALDTGKKRTIAQLIQFTAPFCRLAPDGKTIAFNSYSGGSVNLWLYSVDSGQRRQLTFDKELLGFPAWSPDGKLIAGELKRGDDTYVALVPLDGGAAIPLNSDHGQSWTGSWSPDGDKIAFAGERNGVWNIWWISRATKAEKQITNYSKPNSYVRYPTWSPRGDQIVYEYAELTGNIWLAELR